MVLQDFGGHITKNTSWPEYVTSKADNIIKFLLLVFKKDFVVYDMVSEMKLISYLINVKMSDQIPVLKPLSLERNVAKNWCCWLQQYKLYMCANEKDKKHEKLQCALLLSLASEPAIELSNTFIFEDHEHRKITLLIQKFDD